MSLNRSTRYFVLAVLLSAVGWWAPQAHGQPSCVDDLAASSVPGGVLLTWTPTGANHYNVYRSTISGGPYLKIGATPAPPFLDSLGVVAGTTYYYIIREADAGDIESCQSNEANEQFEIIEPVPTLSTLGLLALALAAGWLAVLRLRPGAAG